MFVIALLPVVHLRAGRRPMGFLVPQRKKPTPPVKGWMDFAIRVAVPVDRGNLSPVSGMEDISKRHARGMALGMAHALLALSARKRDRLTAAAGKEAPAIPRSRDEAVFPPEACMLDWLLSGNRRLLFGLGLLLCALPPVSALASPPAASAHDPVIAAVHEAIAVERLAAQDKASASGGREIKVYIGMETEDLVLQEATLTVADRDAVRIELGHRGAAALQRGGMLRLLDDWKDVGSVPLRVEVLARQTGAGMSAHLVRLDLQTDYAPEAEPLGLRVAVTRDGMFRRHALQRREWSAQP